MKKIKWSSIIIAICYIVAGILFFLDENLTREIVCSWIGYSLLVIGVLSLISYFLHPKNVSFLKNEFRDGLIVITLGIMTLIRKDLFIELVYFVLAIIIVISGYKKLQDCVDACRLGFKNFILYLVLASISIVIGLIVMLDPTIAIKPLHRLIGGGLLYSGVSDLISTIFISSKMYSYIKNIEDSKVEETNDIENENYDEDILEENSENKTPEDN